MIQQPVQQTIFDLMKERKQFTLTEAIEAVHRQKPDVPEPSVRARIYEGIDKGLFTRVSRGVYRCEQNGSSCLIVLGNGRDLSAIESESIDAIVTDHPYSKDTKSLKGGNRSFADYEGFWYEPADFKEKARVLKEGAFLVEFLPEESETNFDYLYKVKKMAQESGLSYYAAVPWRKGKFVANTGRKSKNTEMMVFFTKGKCRSLRPNAKQDKGDPSVKHYMSGAAGMLPVEISVDPPSRKDRVHQAEKPVDLLAEVLKYITLPVETVLDQYAGSGNLAVAAVKTGRNAILYEKDEKIFNNMKANIENKLLS